MGPKQRGAVMFTKSVVDGASPSPSSGNATVARAVLNVTQAADTAELPELAIARAASVQAIQGDHHMVDQHAHILGRMRSSVEDALAKRKEIEELDALRARILLGEQNSEDVDAVLQLQSEHADPAVDQALFGQHNRDQDNLKLPKSKLDEALLKKKTADPRSVISRIDDALDRIGRLKDKLSQDEAKAYDQLLAFNVSVNSLNVARTQASDSAYSVSAASAAVESIMTNLRTAVAAHGGASADVVRLILAS